MVEGNSFKSFMDLYGKISQKDTGKPVADQRFRSKVVEIIFEGHVEFKLIYQAYRIRNDGVYALFVKWHNTQNGLPHPHTHVGLIVRSKDPSKIEFTQLKKSFQVAGVLPTLVQPISKNNQNVKKKLSQYVSYLVNGHDNGKYKDTWNHNYDHEIENLKTNAGKIIVHYKRGLQWKEITSKGDADWEADLCFKMDKYLKMLNNYRKLHEDQTVRHELKEFKSHVVDQLKAWDHTKQVLVIQSEPNMGKTELAKSYAKHVTGQDPLFCSEINKIRFQQGNQPMVLDDMRFETLSREKTIHLTDTENERDIRILFGIHTIPAGTLKIFTTNLDEKEYWKANMLKAEAVDRRYKWINLTKEGKLFHEQI